MLSPPPNLPSCPLLPFSPPSLSKKQTAPASAPPLIVSGSDAPAPPVIPDFKPSSTGFSTITDIPQAPIPAPAPVSIPVPVPTPTLTNTPAKTVPSVAQRAKESTPAPVGSPAVTNPVKWEASAPPPAPTASLTSSLIAPATPNILTGLVADSQHQTLFGATVEIIDSKTGIPTRALRTNRLGQFRIAIPLPPGSYHLQAEKEGLEFDPVSITVNNTILQPILIQSKPNI